MPGQHSPHCKDDFRLTGKNELMCLFVGPYTPVSWVKCFPGVNTGTGVSYVGIYWCDTLTRGSNDMGDQVTRGSNDMKIQWWGSPVMRDPVTWFPGACPVCTEVVLCFSDRKQRERASQLASDRRGSCVWLLDCPISHCQHPTQQGLIKLNVRYAGSKDSVYTTYKEQCSCAVQTD